MDKIIFFATLVLFPFGQIFKIGFVNLFDVSVLLLAGFTILKKPRYPDWYRYFIYFLIACLFGLLANSSLFTVNGSLYLLRFWSYSMVAVYINNYFKKPIINSSLLILSCASAALGWIQYLVWPDLTSFKFLGWDDHLLRMVGTFLDPTYLGLILVLGVVIALHNKHYKTLLFLVISILFTYSRASYLALFVVFVIDLIKNKSIFKFLILNSIFLILFLVPKNVGEGTNLTRTASGNSKLINYEETIQIFKKSPIYGIGFNNMCSARKLYMNDTINDINLDSHACNGADSSILFSLATTGILGLILFVNFILQIKSPLNTLISMSFVAVLIHSLFANSMFYPHVMFWLFALLGLKREVNSQSS